MDNISRPYERRVERFKNLLKKQEKTEKEISIIRLLLFIIELNIGIYFYLQGKKLLLYISLIVFLGTFTFLVISHRRLRNRIKYSKLFIEINNDSLKRINGEWYDFTDDGEDFKDHNHNYSEDLDIFGKRSLFQWINTAKTFIGKQKLRELFSGVVGNLEDIKERQNAVEELSNKLNWRQEFLAEALIESKNIHDPQELISWAIEKNQYFNSPFRIGLIRIMPILTLILMAQGYVLSIIPTYWPTFALVIQFIFLLTKAMERNNLIDLAERYSDDLRAYYNMLKLIEDHRFKSILLQKIQREIRNEEGELAYKQIDELTSIVNAISNRRNSLYSIFNIITLWDFQTIIALEKWKKSSGKNLKTWLEAIGKFEALSSLAVIRYDNQNWTMPDINEEESIFEAEDLGHPLLINRVSNDLTINKDHRVVLITGSNMSGKSTLLRTAGVNLVLAYAGAPVCSSYFKTSIMDIMTCMRVEDNLSESISSFYAELLRIKSIIEEAKSGTRVFYLLDEIFRGTNSIDRHTGAKVLVNKLSDTNSIGMVSTHDLELCDLESENSRIVNFHFREFYEDNEIHFDYKLRSGVSTTRNAIYLMKLAGIEINQ
ncbi:MutS family DNA mismatch repair protein [Tissierella sp. Yu-01]|uniref:MutS family DNA mismatch repair protein n=1 Tax=Tissierella sp. Yu-01 TaxID=3035694 RepID=UPI00240DF633|nr:MutS family DNA mismatch repair protein [Tissierella sp. Yu-01]WFA10112.1 DNA mismatch repair protein [Tissierella sp. Yu-01]